MSRAKSYQADEFILDRDNLYTHYGCTSTDDIVDCKISLLYDFCILKTRSRQAMDSREPKVREILQECGSEHRMTALLHDVLIGNKTIDQLIEQRSMTTV